MAAHPAGPIQSQHWAAVQDLQTALCNGGSEADRQPQTQAAITFLVIDRLRLGVDLYSCKE
jgi:hypothetical protein